MCHVSLQFLFPCENSDILLAKFPHMGHQSSIMETTGIYRFQNFPTFTSLAAKTKWMPLEFGGNLLPVMLLLTRLLLWARLRRFFPKEYGSPACSTNLAILETGGTSLVLVRGDCSPPCRDTGFLLGNKGICNYCSVLQREIRTVWGRYSSHVAGAGYWQ